MQEVALLPPYFPHRDAFPSLFIAALPESHEASECVDCCCGVALQNLVPTNGFNHMSERDLFQHVINMYSFSTFSTPLMKYWLFDSSTICDFKPCIDKAKNGGAFSLGGCRESHFCHSCAGMGDLLVCPGQRRGDKHDFFNTSHGIMAFKKTCSRPPL